MRRKLLTGAFAMVALSSAAVVLHAMPAAAACHFFTAQASPGDPLEGGTVELTVERDAAVVPSSVRVRTVDGSAVAGEDYVGLDQRVEFSSGTTQTVTVETIQDGVDEPDESFTIELSDGEGCEVNQNFQYGPPTSITVRDDDEPATTTQAPTTTAPATSSPTTTEPSDTTEPTTTSTADESVGTGETTTSTTAPTTSTTEAVATTDVEDEAAVDGGDDGTPVGAVIAAVVVLVAVVAGGGALWLRRIRGS